MAVLSSAAILPLAALYTVAEGLDHSEGIVSTAQGELYVGGELGQVYRVHDDGSVEERLRTGGLLLGLAADAAGLIYACDATNGVVWRCSPQDGTFEEFTRGSADRAMSVPNWGAFDADGTYYVSDSGAWKRADGCIWVVPPGEQARVWSTESCDFPNGLAVDPFSRRLLVLESTPGRLVEMTIRADGSAGPRRVLCDLPGTVPDGIAVQQDRSVLIACYRPDVILRWDPASGLALFASDPEGTVLAAPTNVAFVGPDLDRWVVPNLGRWHLTGGGGVHGTPLNYPTATQLSRS